MSIDLQKERAKYKCCMCDEPASSIIAYSKYYPAEKRATIEEPALVCLECGEGLMGWRGRPYWMPPTPEEKIPKCYWIRRGGDETLVLLPIKALAKMPIKKVAKDYLSLNNYETNHLATPEWRKRVMRLRFLYLPSKEKKDGQKD